MKLKTFNQSNLPVVAKGKPTIRLSLPSGLITISPVAGEILGLTKNSHVEFCQNEDTPSDWYLHVTNAPPRISSPAKERRCRLLLQLYLDCKEVFRRNKIRGEILFLHHIPYSRKCLRREVLVHCN